MEIGEPTSTELVSPLTVSIQRGSGGSDDEDGIHEEEKGVNTYGLSDLDYGMARYRGLLEKKYANDHDGGYSFVSSDGTTLPLTPLMMKEWARSIVRRLHYPATHPIHG